MTVSRDHYYQLASDIEKERIEAAVSLINELTEAKEEAEWEYALNRLIKGLSSSRGSSRLGFSTCLTEIVSIRIVEEKLDFSTVVKLINENNKVTSSMNGKEERSALFGRLFGLQSLSNLIATAGNKGSIISNEDFKLFIDNLINLSCQKSWIREPSLFTIFNILKQGNYDNELTLYIFSKIDENKLSLTTESLALYLLVPHSFKQSQLSQYPFKNKTWVSLDPLNKANVSTLTKVLKDISTGEDEENGKELKKKGSWSPRLHFVWDILIKKSVSETEAAEDSVVEEEEQGSNSKKRKKSSEKKSKKPKHNSKSSALNSDRITIQEFWKVIIDESFFSEKASHERKYWGFEIFSLLFNEVNALDVPSLFTQNFLRTLINQSSDSNRLLNKIAKKTLNRLLETTSSQPSKVVPTLENLLTGEYGSLQFDRLTKTKTIETLINHVGSPNEEISRFFIGVLENPCTVKKESDILKVQKWVIDQLLHLVRAKKSILNNTNELEWIDNILKALVKVAYFTNGTKNKEDEEEDPIVEVAQERLNSVLSDVVSVPRTDNQTWPYKTLSSLISLIEKGNKLIFEFDDEINTSKDKALKTLKKIRSKRESSNHLDSSSLLVFELLFSMVLLELFSGDAESVNTLQELQDYYHEFKKNESSESSQDSIVGIVEILLNFMSQKTSLLKKLSLIVWENFCNKVNLESLTLLFDVITTKENKEGERLLFEGEGEYVDEDAESEEEHSHAEDQDEEDENEEGDESESENELEEDDNDELNEVEKKTNVALAEALKIPQHDGEVVLSSDDDFSEDSMDDEQMMEIDDQLSKIFKQRRDALNKVQSGNKRKQEVEEARSNVLLFKSRVVDLLETFVKKNQNSELIIELILPLLKGMKLTLDKSLGQKIHKLLKNRICKVKITEISCYSKDKLLDQLRNIHADLLKNNTVDYNLSSSQCAIFISKLIIQLDENSVDQIIDIYSDLLKNWFKKKNAKLTTSIFFDFINWLNSKRSQ